MRRKVQVKRPPSASIRCNANSFPTLTDETDISLCNKEDATVPTVWNYIPFTDYKMRTFLKHGNNHFLCARAEAAWSIVEAKRPLSRSLSTERMTVDSRTAQRLISVTEKFSTNLQAPRLKILLSTLARNLRKNSPGDAHRGAHSCTRTPEFTNGI